MKIVGFLAICFVALAVGACDAAKAVEPDRQSSRTAALQAREARITGLIARVGAKATAACPAGLVAWDRGTTYGDICAQPCRSDQECTDGSRCRVVGEPGTENPEVLVLDVGNADAVANEEALDAAVRAEPIMDAQPECDAECAPYTGNLAVSASPPLALCDPLWDAE